MRSLKMWFLYVAARLFCTSRAPSVRAYMYSFVFLYDVARLLDLLKKGQAKNV